jgi:phosphopantetheine--protein transferase-like protein
MSGTSAEANRGGLSAAFRLSSPFGSCAGVWLPEPNAELALRPSSFEELHEGERRWADANEPGRRPSWIGGRVALREALRQLGADVGAILADSRGAPALPEPWAGSISHKHRLAVALAEHAAGFRVGIDVEEVVPLRPAFARRLLSDRERTELAGTSDERLGLELIWRFSAKEAIYKALDPFVRRYVAFSEVSLRRRRSGRVDVELSLAHADGAFVVDLHTSRFGPYCLSFARVRPAT